MDKQKLTSSIKLETPIDNFIFNEVGYLWGCSYVRVVSGKISDFKSIEHFFWSLINNKENQASVYLNQKTWSETVNYQEWSDNLKINNIDNSKFKKEIEDSLREYEAGEVELTEDEKINKKHISPNLNLIKSWSIDETVQLRHPVGETQNLIGKTEDSYFYMENHWES